MDIPYPSQHKMSSNHWPLSEMPFKCFRCCIAKKEERKAGVCVCGGGGGGGGGVGDQLESPVETHSIFLVFFCMCCCCFCTFKGVGVDC